MKHAAALLLVVSITACGGGGDKQKPLSTAELAKLQRACELMSDNRYEMTVEEYNKASTQAGFDFPPSTTDLRRVCPDEARNIAYALERETDNDPADALASRGPVETNSDESFIAQHECEQFVKERLKSPSSADFSNEERGDAGGHQYVVTGTVDAQNSYGATLRSRWSCTITILGEQARLDNLDIEDQ